MRELYEFARFLRILVTEIHRKRGRCDSVCDVFHPLGAVCMSCCQVSGMKLISGLTLFKDCLLTRGQSKDELAGNGV